MIRGAITAVTWIAGVARKFTGTGRVGETFRSRDFYQHFGFCSNPPAGTKIIVIKNGNLIMSIAEDDPATRPDLDALDGAAALHSDADHFILIKKNGDICLGGATGLKKLVTEELITKLTTVPDSMGGIYTALQLSGCTTTQTEAK